jgi:hypothetical protein
LSDPSGDGKCLGSQGLRWVGGSEVWAVRSLEGQTRREAATKVRACSGQCERTRGGSKASKQVKLAVGTILPLVTQGDREASLRTRRKGAHSSWGIQATASSVGVGETSGDKVTGGAFQRTVDNCKGAGGLERDHDLREGNLEREGSLGTVAA